MNMANEESAICHHCERSCKTVTDKWCGEVSLCCGVGYSFEDTGGEIVDINSGMRYVSEWNE
tara:strand:+ start:129 stop:314 length:186 start_codon:yes stop_codon:yes gene_type:complete